MKAGFLEKGSLPDSNYLNFSCLESIYQESLILRWGIYN